MPPDPLVGTHAYVRYYHPATILFFPAQLEILYETLHTHTPLIGGHFAALSC